jgi:hypothetical protein
VKEQYHPKTGSVYHREPNKNREEVEMKSPVLKTFLVGVAFGIGITVLSLYAQKPGCFVTSLETIAEMGRARRAKEKENNFLRKKLRAMGFSDKEINENL